MAGQNYKFKISRRFDYAQTTPATVWTFNYPEVLGYPVVDVLVDTPNGLTKIIPKSTKMLSGSIVEIEFTQPYSGLARVVV